MGMLLALSNTQAEADQSSFSPQNEQSGDRCSPIMLMACTSPQPSVFTPQLSGRKLSPATGVGSASLRVWPGARAFRNSPRPRTSGSLWVSSSTPCSSGRTTQGHVLHGLSEVSSGAESHLPLVATCPFLSLPPSPTPGPVLPKTSSQITCLHSKPCLSIGF